MSMKDTSKTAGRLLASTSAISFATVTSWRAINSPGKTVDTPCLLVAFGVWSDISRCFVRLHRVCMGLLVPSGHCWLFLFINGHIQAEPQAGCHSFLFCKQRRKSTSGGSVVRRRYFPAFLFMGVEDWSRDGDGDQLVHVNYDSGLNIKGWRSKKQRCERREKEKEERIGVMLQEDVFARSKGLSSMR